MAILTKAQLEALNQSSFPDQSTEAITPAILRNYNTQTIDTLVDSLDTGSFVTSAITASSLITASFSGNTLTFTKGNGTTFGVVIPDVSGSTGNFATTGSNTFVGNQTISGSLFVSGSEVLTGTLSASALRVENNTHLDGQLRVTNDAQFDTNILIQGAQPHLKLRDTSGGGFSSGYDIRIDTGSFEIHDDTHNRDVLSDFFDSASASHTTSLTSEIIVISGSTSVTLIGNVSASIISASTINGLGNPLTFSASVDSRINAITSSGGIPAGTVSSSAQITALGFVSSSVTASSLVTASFSGNTLTFTKGDSSTFGVVIPDISGSTIDTGSFATTGSNTFIGDETFADASGNASTLTPFSGSLVFVAKGSTSGSAGLSNITSSTSTQLNLILKTNNNQSGSLTISGSGNILFSAQAPTAGFIRYVGNQNIAITTALPLITGSAAYSPTVNFNYFNLGLVFRGPASSSAWTFNNNILNANLNVGSADATSANQAIAGGTMSTNILLSTVNYNAYTTPLVTNVGFSRNLAVGIDTVLTAFSSSIQANSNIFNGNSFNISNSYYGTASTAAAQRLGVSFNVFGGINSSRLTASGSNTTAAAPREVIGNTTNGSGILLGAVLNGDNSNLYSTLVHGSNLTVTGSSAYNTYQTAGGAFIGRNNSVNGTAASSGETVFAVGTGTSTSNRKTGFLIDSGSNTFVEGTLNVSGSTSFTGSAPTILSSSFSGSLITNLTDIYTDIPSVNQIVTLTSASYAGLVSGSLVDPNTLYVVSGSTITTINTGSFVTTASFNDYTSSNDTKWSTLSNVTSSLIAATGSYATIGSNVFVGNQTITGSLILSSSATVELQVIGNMILTGSAIGNVVSMSVTSNTASMDFNLGNYFVLTASVSPIRIEVSNLNGGNTSTLALNGVTSSTITFSSNVLQPSGSAYTASVSGSNDILSFVAFNSSKVNVVSTLKMI